MRKDSYSNVSAVQALAPAVKSVAEDGVTIDTKGFFSLLFVLNTGAIAGSGDFGIKVQEAVTGSGDWQDAAASDVLAAVPATLEASSAYRIAYLGSKRFARLTLTKAGGTSIAAGAVAILGMPQNAPVA